MHNAQHPVTGQSYVLESWLAAEAIAEGDKVKALELEMNFLKAKAKVERIKRSIKANDGYRTKYHDPNEWGDTDAFLRRRLAKYEAKLASL